MKLINYFAVVALVIWIAVGVGHCQEIQGRLPSGRVYSCNPTTGCAIMDHFETVKEHCSAMREMLKASQTNEKFWTNHPDRAQKLYDKHEGMWYSPEANLSLQQTQTTIWTAEVAKACTK